MAGRHRVVIVGGGFGGLRAARALKSAPVDVTLIDRRNYHLFQPLLYQVATGSLSPGDVVDVDPASRRVVLADGAGFPYDALIVAAGSQSSYYGHDEWRQWAPSLKSVEEAATIRHKILYAFEVAERLSDPVQRRAWLTFAIVGAGATGVELASARRDCPADPEERLPIHPSRRSTHHPHGRCASRASALPGGPVAQGGARAGEARRAGEDRGDGQGDRQRGRRVRGAERRRDR